MGLEKFFYNIIPLHRRGGFLPLEEYGVVYPATPRTP